MRILPVLQELLTWACSCLFKFQANFEKKKGWAKEKPKLKKKNQPQTNKTQNKTRNPNPNPKKKKIHPQTSPPNPLSFKADRDDSVS